jgi:hypothetical protein
MSEIKVNNITNYDGSSGPVISGITTVSSTGYMTLPKGPTEYRGGRGRGVWAGGRLAPTPATVYTNSIEYVQISTLSDTLDFGDLSFGREHVSGNAVASSTRGIWAGGYGAPGENHISYIQLSSTGNSFDFGDLTGNTRNFASHSNNTRGIFGPRYQTPAGEYITQIQYITIATTGNAAEFGQLDKPGIDGAGSAGVGDSTRAIFCGGYISDPTKNTDIYYVTIASFGNAIDFGDINDGSVNSASASGSGRGLIAGGRRISGSPVNAIDYITIQSLGDSLDFGDLTSNRNDWRGGASNGTRAIFAGGSNPSYDDSMDYVEIMTTGNAQDFGNLSAATRYKAGCSDSHGGLG